MNEKTSSKFKIRRTHDCELVESLHAKIFPTDDWYNNEKSVYWIVWKDKEPVGFCMLAPFDDNIVFLSRAGLLEVATGKGLHGRMIRVRERFAREYKFSSIITYTIIGNIKSSRNLQKAGYFLYIPEYQYASDDDDVLYWLKEI